MLFRGSFRVSLVVEWQGVCVWRGEREMVKSFEKRSGFCLKLFNSDADIRIS